MSGLTESGLRSGRSSRPWLSFVGRVNMPRHIMRRGTLLLAGQGRLDRVTMIVRSVKPSINQSIVFAEKVSE